MDFLTETVAQEIIREQSTLAGERGNFENLWRQIAVRLHPAGLQTFNAFTSGFQAQGDVRTNEMLDSTGAVALGRFAAILDSLLTPRNSTWHRIIPSNPNLSKDRDVRLWFENANRLLFKYRYAPDANFASQNQMVFESLGGYGTGALFIDRLHDAPGLRYRAVHLGEIYITENHQGRIDGAYRCFQMTARQAFMQWKEKAPKQIKDALARTPERKFSFIHRVKKRASYDPERKDFRGMPYSSHYISVEAKEVIEEGGYRVFPYAISRYKQSSNEVYGRSPGMEVLPALKTLNEQKRVILKQGQRVVDPVLLAHDDGIADTFSLRSGAFNTGAVSADGRPLVHVLPTGNIAVGKDLMDDEKDVIRDAFLVNLMQIVTDTPQMTATEALERTREKGILMAPTVGRQQSEYLGPGVERELDLLMMQGLLDEMPPALVEAEGEYSIEYDSPISRAQRAEEGAGLQRTVEHALNVANITGDKAPLDMFNWDVIMPAIAEINGVPLRWLRSPEDIAAIRAQRAEAAETQEVIQGAPAAAAMMKAAAVAEKA